MATQIPWLEHWNSSWQVKPLFTCCSEHSRKNYKNVETNVLSLSYGKIVRRDVDNNFGLLPESFESYNRIDSGDLILRLTDLQNDTTSLRVGAVAESGIITSAYVALRCNSECCPSYLYYLLNLYDIHKVFYGLGGGVRQSVKFDELKWLPVLVPTVYHQKAIANFLDHKTTAVDRLITKKGQLIELLQEKRQSLIFQAVTKGLDPTVPMRDSGIKWLGEIPEHWATQRLKHVSPRISGRLVYQPAQYFADEGVPFLMANNVTERGIVWDGVKLIPEDINRRFAHHALREGDVVTVRVGAPGVTCVVPKEADGLNCGSLMIIRRGAPFESGWLAYVMNSPIVKTQIDLVQYGAAQEQININDAVNFAIPLPDRTEQAQIAKFLDERVVHLDILCSKLEASVKALSEYRQILISAAVTGELPYVEEQGGRM